MGLDIDSFLNKLASSSSKDETKKAKGPEINLEFDKDVKSNLEDIEKDFSSEDLFQLKEIYSKLKEFDESMPTKFLNIETSGSNSLLKLNESYSSKLLNTLKNNSILIEKQVNENINLIKNDIISKEFKISKNKLNESKELLSKFPKEFSQKKHEPKKLWRV